MSNAKLITKSSGLTEPFSAQKFERSLHRAGAKPEVIAELTDYVLHAPDLKTTHDIYQYAYNRLRSHRPAVAARYSLKNALSALGPSGFPFERFVAEIFKSQGYEASIDQKLQGRCVLHEVDIVLSKGNDTYMVECKFHQPQLHADVKVPLYIKSRFDDLTKNNSHTFKQGWVVTNTRFTDDAITYGTCVGLRLISWSYPDHDNLAQMIDSLGLHPITALTSLSKQQKKFLIEHGLVLCKDASKNIALLQQLGFNERKIQEIVSEAQEACELGSIN